MATKKNAKGKLTAVEKNKIKKALNDVEKKLVTNYRNVAKVSGANLTKGTKKIKADLTKAKKKIDVEIRKNPAGATIAAAVLGAIAGAVVMSKLRKK